jgi:hypothetical protein
MKKENMLPVVDDVDFRKKQTERVVGGIESVGKFFEEVKKHQKINLILGIVYAAIFILLVGGVFGYSVFKGGFFGMIDENAPIRKIDCSNGVFNDTLRTYTDAELFIKIFGGECKLRLSK